MLMKSTAVRTGLCVWGALALAAVAAAESPEVGTSRFTPARELRAPASDLDGVLKQKLNVSAYTLQDVEVENRGAGELAFSMNLAGLDVTATVNPHSVRHADFQVLVDRGTGALEPVESGPPETFRGVIASEPGSVVAGQYRNGQLWALVRRADGSIWSVQPISEMVDDAPANRSVVFSSADQVAGPWRCGNDLPGSDANAVKPAPGSDETQQLVGDRVAEIAIDADFEFFGLNQSNVASTRADIENVMNSVESIYEGEAIDISYEITTIIVRTVAGAPYTPGQTNSSVLLNIFRDSWNQSQRTIRRDIAHLFTGRNIDGNIIGVAFLSQICSNVNNGNGYGLSESRFTSSFPLRTSLTAHELGHNWGAGHCNQSDCLGPCGVMCAGINSCGSSATTFFTCSADQIINFRNSRPCLNAEPAPSVVPFVDEFSVAAIDINKWSWINGVDTFQAGGAPSAPFAMQINGTSTIADEIRSTFIPLTGISTARASYSIRSVAPAGRQLFIDYYANNFRWNTLRTFISEGLTNSFSPFADPIPADGRWAEFRLRFRTDAIATSQIFFVDNIRVGAALPCPADYNGDLELNQEDLSGFITAYFDEATGVFGYWQICGFPNPALGFQADFNRDCGLDQEDLSGFITAYFDSEICL